MKIDSTKSALANVIALVLSANPNSGVAAEKVTLGTPTADSSQSGLNTSLVLTAVEGSGFTGEQTVFYSRLALTETVATPTTEFDADAESTEDTVRAEIIKALDLIEAEVELTGTVAEPTDGTSTSTLSLAPVANSLVYQGDAVTITLKWTKALATAVSTTNQSGFDSQASAAASTAATTTTTDSTTPAAAATTTASSTDATAAPVTDSTVAPAATTTTFS